MAIQRTRVPLQEQVPSYGVYVLESHHDEGFQMETRQHAFMKVLYVLSGAGRYVTGRRTVALEAGDVVMVPIGQLHRIEDEPRLPLSLYVLCVTPRLWRQEPALERLLPAGRLPRDPALSRRLREQLRRLLYEQTLAKSAHATMIVGLTLHLLATVARSAGRRTPATDSRQGDARQRVRRYVDELDRRFFEATHLDAVAANLAMSRRRFTQLFRELTGSSWLSHTRRLRIDHARRLLRDTERTVISIAFECGFDDLSSFYRAFRKEARTSPTRWREAAAARSRWSAEAQMGKA